jgi:glucokinase
VGDLVRRLGPDLPIGIGIASMVDRSGRLVEAPNLHVEGFPLRQRLADVVEGPVTVVNDASAACLAEARVGAAADHADVVLLTVGTGVGGGAMVGGRPVLGAHGMATEFGHMIVAEGGRRCPCGSHGCLEAYASGRAIGHVAAERLAEGRTSAALAREPVIDGVAVTRAARDGDPLAVEVIREAGFWLGVGIAGLVNALDPGIVLVGGGAGQALAEWLLPAARSAAEPRVLGHGRRPVTPVTAAALGDEAGVVGAALLALDDAPH